MSEIWWNICIGLHVKNPLFMSYFNETLIFSTFFKKSNQISNFMKIRPLEAELFHADIPKDLTNLMATFCNFVKDPKIFVNFCVSCSVFKWPCFFIMDWHTPVLLTKLGTKLAVKINNEDKCAYFLIWTYFLETCCHYTADIKASIMYCLQNIKWQFITQYLYHIVTECPALTISRNIRVTSSEMQELVQVHYLSVLKPKDLLNQ